MSQRFTTSVRGLEIKLADPHDDAHRAVAYAAHVRDDAWRVGPGALDASKFTSENIDAGVVIHTTDIEQVREAAEHVARSLINYETAQQEVHQDWLDTIQRVPNMLEYSTGAVWDDDRSSIERAMAETPPEDDEPDDEPAPEQAPERVDSEVVDTRRSSPYDQITPDALDEAAKQDVDQ